MADGFSAGREATCAVVRVVPVVADEREGHEDAGQQEARGSDGDRCPTAGWRLVAGLRRAVVRSGVGSAHGVWLVGSRNGCRVALPWEARAGRGNAQKR